MEGRFGLKAGAVVTFAALIACTSAATTSFAAEPTEVSIPTPQNLEDGRYIVLLDDAPAATYEGGEAGLTATKPAEGDKLDATTDAVVEYSSHLENLQDEVAAEVGATPDANLTITLNAFTANLTASQAKQLAATNGVSAVVPDEILHPTAVPSTEFLGLEGDNGVWETYAGGPEGAGEGVVVGVIDTGIAPENPSFAGEPLGTTSGATPYLEGNTVVFNKADGGQFRSDRVTGDQWNLNDYSTKLIAAHYFSAGAAASGFDFQWDILSPRDGAGHGSHTASTAAGNYNVETTVSGLDFGPISGVAPAAKIASYKTCYEGPDPAVTTDDICAGSDLLAAIDRATKDGVDVINFSIGGGAATTVWDALDQAFFNAATAGIFVSASAGNSGPDYVTADHASPWYTTVAASTIPTYEGTVVGEGFEAPGATVSVPQGGEVTGDAIYAGDVAASGATAANAALCLPNTLDASLVAGKIVVCDRGSNARVDKSANVQAAGGIGMVLVNVGPGSLDTDMHSVPTVHIADTYRADLLATITETPEITLLPQNITDFVTPVPQIAGFSSRGPMMADGSDILKPDIAAPGVNILAAVNNVEDAAPQWGLMSGTSMAAPHIAGLAALYLGERPQATPGEIKSALMTTAYDTVDSEDASNPDPFAQGAGQVDAELYFNAGLLYLNGPADWAAYLEGKGLYEFDGVEPIDGSDLNLASISIGSLAAPQTVTRTVTAQTAGTYEATIDVPGVTTVVEPSSITLAAGESATFTVSFENATAPTEQWATGFLTWSSDTIDVRSPIAVFPTAADAPLELYGEGVEGVIDYSITPGYDGELPLNLSGLTPYVLHEDTDNPVPGHSGNQDSGDADGKIGFILEVQEGAELARIDLDSSDDAGSDLDLTVYHLVSPTSYDKKYDAQTGSADEQVTIHAPAAGTYFILVDMYSVSGPMTWDLTTAVVDGAADGALTATPNPVAATKGVSTPVSLSWAGLENDQRYLGYVQYGDSAVSTIVTVDAGAAAPANTAAPVLSGSGVAGETLTVTPGEWDQDGLTFKYEWLKNGEAIAVADAPAGVNAVVPPDATDSSTYTPTAADVGATISVRVYASAEGNPNAGTADSNGIVITAAPTTSPTPTVDPTDPTNPTVAPTTAPTTPGAGGLPVTGAPDATLPLLVGFLIVALGGAAFVIGRKRRAHAE